MKDLSPDEGKRESSSHLLAATHEIRDLEALRTIADPLRLRIFEQLAAEPQTVKAVAAKLGLTPGRLYYHFNLLEERGLIKIRDRHIIGNLVEKVYAAVARTLDVHHDLLSFGGSCRQGEHQLAGPVDAGRNTRGLAAQPGGQGGGTGCRGFEHARSIMVTRDMQCIPESKAEEFAARLKELFDDFDDAALDDDSARDGAHMYALTVAFYQHFDYVEVTDDEA